MLGKGAFGKVNLGVHKLTGKFVAIKSLNKELLTDEHSKKKVMKEVSILQQLRHQSVIRLYETFESKKHILFVIELCTGGDLLTYVRKRRKLKEKIAKNIFKQVNPYILNLYRYWKDYIIVIIRIFYIGILNWITYCSIQKGESKYEKYCIIFDIIDM